MQLGSHNKILMKHRLIRGTKQTLSTKMRFTGNVAGYRNAIEELNSFSISYNVQNMKQESRTVQDEVRK